MQFKTDKSEHVWKCKVAYQPIKNLKHGPDRAGGLGLLQKPPVAHNQSSGLKNSESLWSFLPPLPPFPGSEQAQELRAWS